MRMKKQYTQKAPQPKTKRGNYRSKNLSLASRGVRVAQKYATKGGMAYTALRLARRIADAVNIEYKIHDTILANASPDYNGTITSLNIPAQAITDVGRIGDSIKVQNVTIRGQVVANVAADKLSHTRVMLIWDEQNQISALSDLLETTGSSNVVWSPKHYDKRFRSIILFDQMFTTSTYSGSQAFWKDFTINLPINKHTQFSAGSTTINTGALKMVTMSSGVTTDLPSLTYYSRCTFTDD